MKARASMVDDSLRMENFLEALPGDTVKRLVGQLSELRLNPDLSLDLENIRVFFSNPNSNFSDIEVKRAQKELNKSFRKLDSFQLSNFEQSGWGDYRLRPNLTKNGEHLEKLTHKLKLLTNDFRTKYENFLASTLKISGGGNVTCGGLKFNLNDGDTVYHRTKTNFKPESDEYKILSALVNKPNQRLSYTELNKALSKNENTKKGRRDISFIVRNIKNKLEIKTKNKPGNKNIIKPCNGYKIVCE